MCEPRITPAQEQAMQELVDQAQALHMGYDEPDLPPWIDLMPAEAAALFDRECQRRLGMSGAAFRAAWHGGQFDADPDTPGVMYCAMLLPLVEEDET